MPTHYGPQRGNQEREDYGFRSVEEPWNPSYTEEQVQEYIDAYKVNPRQFDPDFLRTVNQHAAHYKMPFAYNEADHQASVGSLVSNLGSGFVEGFTTLRIDKDQPTNEWDAIAKNIGHLAGFVGFLPLSTPLKFLKFKKLAGAVRALKGKSVPMLVAGAATKKAKKVARSMTSGARDARVAAGKDALSVFDRHPMMKDIVEGSFHLGVASSVSSWQGGIDEMMHGLIGGAQTGAAFRGIGNLVKGFGPQGDKAVRGLVSSLYTGLPSTMQGQTTPEQVYQYLLGAYFGVNEMPYHRRQGQQFHNKWAWGDKKKPEGWIGEPFESVPGWEKLDEVTKRYIEDVVHPKWKETNSEYAAAVLMEKAGIRGEGGGLFFSKEEAELRQILKEELQEKEYTDVEVFNESEISRVKTAMEEGTLEKIGDDVTSEQLETPIQTKIQQFVDKEMEDIWMEAAKPAEQKLVTYVQIQKKWNELIEKAQKDRVNPDQEMRIWLAETYGIDANRESIQNEWRAFGNRILKARPVAMITTKVNPDGTVTVSKLPFGATNDAGKQKILQTEPHLIQKIYEDVHRQLYPDKPIKSKFGSEGEFSIGGINIYSRSDDPLGRALTNPVWGSVKDGKHYFNVEAAYKRQKTGDLVKDKELMRDLIIQKFQQNPELVDQITERGGVAFLEASSHSVSPKYDKTSRWTGEGKESEFINTLIDAYKEVGPEGPELTTSVPLVDTYVPTNKEPKIVNNYVHFIKGYGQKTAGTFRKELLDANVSSTHDAIEAGFRTGTSRRESVAKSLSVGQVIDVGRKGEKLFARVTKISDKTLGQMLKSGEITPEEWSKREGWTPDYLEKNPDTKSKYLVDFELVPKGPATVGKVIAFHGTPEVFEELDITRAGTTTRGPDTREAVFFTSSKETADTYRSIKAGRELRDAQRVLEEITNMPERQLEYKHGISEKYRAGAIIEAKEYVEKLQKELDAFRGGQILEKVLDYKNAEVIDGKKFAEEYGHIGELLSYLGSSKFRGRLAKKKKDVVIIHNIDFSVTGDKGRSTIYMVLDPAVIKAGAAPRTFTDAEGREFTPLAWFNSKTGKITLDTERIAADYDAGFPYLQGKQGPTSEQKKLVLERMEIKLDNLKKFLELRGGKHAYEDFILLHEEGHRELGHSASKDLFSEETLKIEQEATQYAIDIMKSKPYYDPATPEFNKMPRPRTTPSMRYAGIGARETPKNFLDQMTDIASKLEVEGYILRSGGAKGADTAFEKGHTRPSEIFYKEDATGQTRAIAKEMHPAPERLTGYGLDLQARNTNQLFGKNLDTPVDFVLTWTPGGQAVGGTGQALRMAAPKGIPIINMAKPGWRAELQKVVEKNNQANLDNLESVERLKKQSGAKAARPAPSPSVDVEMILDHAVVSVPVKNPITERTKMTSQELRLSELPEFYRNRIQNDPNFKGRTSEEIDSLVQNAVDEHHGQVFYNMSKKGYYYYSGRGDAHRQIFVKYHPLLKGVSSDSIQKHLDNLFKIMPKEYKEDYRKDEKAYWYTYQRVMGENVEGTWIPKTDQLFAKEWLSNLLYLHSLGFGKPARNIGESIEAFKRMHNKKDKDGNVINSYIKSPKDFNKRVQIWFTSGISVDVDYIKKMRAEDGKLQIRDFNKDGTFNIMLTAGPERFNQRDLKNDALAELYNEIEDGAIIVRSDVLKAILRQAGLPSDSGFEKSFLAAPDPVYGALTGKYAMYPTRAKMDAWMKRNNVHFIVNALSVKQKGERDYVTYDWDARKQTVNVKKYNEISKIEGEPVTDISKILYKLDPKYFRTITEEYASKKNLKDVQVHKQVFTNLTPYAYSPIDLREIQDMYNGLVNKRIKGDADVNKDLKKFLSDPAGQQAMVKPLVKNLKKLGINELLRAMRSNNPHVQKFTAKIYNAMFRIEPSMRDALRAEGETSAADTHLENLLSLENKGVYERIMRITDDDLSGVLHKWSTRIRGSVVRNFFVDQVTRPLATNSVSARMRPYDPAMRQEDGFEGKTTELNKRDDIFFLDDLHKNKWFKIAGDKPMQLKDLWKGVDAANKGRPIKGFPTEKAREILRALVVRTPMDSISGGHVLEFAGFTGVDGYGVLLHPRTLKALGGADLDGDKAQVYFGDEAHGMKKSWKDMYHKNKNEYLNQVTNQIETNKPADLEARFGTDNTELIDRLKNPNLILSPLARRNASEGAAYGRDLMGPVVVNRATTSATHAAIASLPDRKEKIKVIHDIKDPKRRGIIELEVDVPAGHYLFEVKKRTGFTREGEPEYQRQWLIIEAKTDVASLHEFRRVARALMGFTSDPMDIAGMQNRESVINDMKSTILKLNIAKIGRDGKITKGASDPHPDFEGINNRDKYMPTRLFGNVNSTLYGKFKEQNRRYYAYEIQKAQEELYSAHRKRYDTDLKGFLHQPGFVGAERNSYLALIANDMKDIDFSESIFRRLKREEGENGLEEAVKKLYNDHNDLVKPGQKFDWLRDKLDRGSLWVPDGEVINKVITNHLFEKYGYERQLDPKRWDIDLMDHYYGKSPEYMEDKKIPVKRALWLNDYIKAAEDLFVNDLSDITSIKLLDHWARKVKDKRVINSIWKKTERFKLQAAINDGKEPLRGQIGYKDTLFEQQQNLADSKETSKIIPRVELDREMQDYRDGLKSNEQKKLFDHFMLGTLNRKESKQQSMLQAAAGTINPEEVMSSKDKIDTGHKTSLVKIGFASSAVSDNSIKEYFKEYSKVFDKVDDTLTPKEIEGAKEYAENLEEPRLIPTADGLTVSGSHLNTNSKSAESDKYIDEIAPFEGLKTGKVSKEEGKVINSIIDHIEYYFGDQPIYGKYFNQIVRGVLHKDVNAMTSRDIRVLDNYFKNIRNKGFINTVLDFFSKSKANQLPKRIYYNFPEANNKLLMSHDIAFIEKKALFKNKRGDPIMGNIRQPTQIVNELRDLHGNAQTLILKQQDEYRVEMQDEFAEIFVLEDGYKIYEMAGRMMESFGEIRLEDNLSDVPISGVVKDYLEKRIEMGKALTSAETSFLYEVYQEALNRAVVNSDWHIVKNKDYVIGGRKVKGSQLATEILRKLTKENSKLHTWHIGDGKTAKKYLDDIMAELEKVDFIDLELSHFTKGGERIYRDIGNLSDTKLSEIVDNNLGALRSMRKKFLKDAKDNKIPLELGMDNLNRIVRYMQLHEMHGAYTSEAGRQGKINFLGSLKSVKEDITDTGKYSFNNYFPHISYERKLAAQGLLKYIEHLSVDPDLLKHTKERQRLIQAAILRHRQLEGDFVKGTQLQESWKDVAEVLHGLANDKRDVMVNGFKRFNKNRKVSSQFSRIAHAEGWIVSPDAYERYVKNVINTFHQQIADVSGRDAIYQFKNHKNSANKRLGRELTDLWSEFLYLYHEQAGGNPTNIPKYVLDNPQMNIKGTAYAWFADNMVARRLNKAREMLGLRKGVQKLAGIPITGSLTDEDLKTLKDVDFNTLKKLGQMEAKYQLATLLAHPKSTVANLYGGSVHTLISTGWEHYKNAKSIKYLRLHVNKNWKSMEDVNDWVKSLGIIEEFLIFEADMNPNIKSANMQKAVREAIGAIKKDPNLPDRNLYRIAQKHGITESAFNKAASFMRVPERFLRRDAFMAHYLQAREKFGNLTPEFDNQTLVEMAKKGVKATQFLYSAPYRPAFANSQLGKVMTRFQIWAWNSVRFRRQIVEQAHIYGWKEGTQQFEAFKRLAIADMFMLGLSNIFMYSIFENALPAPWNWFQDTADLMFGDDKERERAFFGAYPYPFQPLQIITPPALRLLPPMFKAMVTDDYSRLADYYIWTMFPFGRLMRDVVGPGGIIENPMRTVEKTTGIPYMQFGKYFKAMQEQERLKPGG